MSLRSRLAAGHFDHITTPGTTTSAAFRRSMLARWEEFGNVPAWLRLALTNRLPVKVEGGAQ